MQIRRVILTSAINFGDVLDTKMPSQSPPGLVGYLQTLWPSLNLNENALLVDIFKNRNVISRKTRDFFQLLPEEIFVVGADSVALS